jgi:outer membrane biosynthesis protein TonB
MPDLPLPKFTRSRRPELSVDEMLAKGREAAAAEGLIITGDTPPPPPVEQPAPEPDRAALGPAPEPEPPAPAPAAPATSRPSRQPAKSKAKAGDKPERQRWGTEISPALLLGLRKLALERNVSPYDVLEDAVSAYLRDQSKR